MRLKKVFFTILMMLILLMAFVSCENASRLENNENIAPNLKAEGYNIVFVSRNDYSVGQSVSVNFKDYSEMPEKPYFYSTNLHTSAEKLTNLPQYDSEFFEDRVLLVINFESGSGSYRYYVSSIYKNDKSLAVGISQVMEAADIVVTDDVRSWSVYVEIDRVALGNIGEFKAFGETRHKIYDTDVDGLHMQHTLSLDMNSEDFVFCYFTDQDENITGEKWYKTVKRYEIVGKYKLDSSTLTLFPKGEESGKIVFDYKYGELLYNSKKTTFKIDLPFGNKTGFEEWDR